MDRVKVSFVGVPWDGGGSMKSTSPSSRFYEKPARAYARGNI